MGIHQTETMPGLSGCIARCGLFKAWKNPGWTASGYLYLALYRKREIGQTVRLRPQAGLPSVVRLGRVSHWSTSVIQDYSMPLNKDLKW